MNEYIPIFLFSRLKITMESISSYSLIKSTTTDFCYLIDMALQNKMPWNSLASLLKDLTPNLEDSHEVIAILLKKLQTLHLQTLEKENQENLIGKDVNLISNDSQTQNVEIDLHTKIEIENFEPDLVENHIESNDLEKTVEATNESPLIEQNEIPSKNEAEYIENVSYILGNNSEHDLQAKKDTLDNLKVDHKVEPLMLNSKFHKKSNQCDICSNYFTTPQSLKIHKRVHTGEKPYECKTCKKRFRQIGGLNTHELLHLNIKPYQCNSCDKSFPQKHALKYHEMSHSGKPLPFECKTCKKTFKTNGNLTSHERTHTGEKPYHCKTCDKCFRNESTLREHVRIHTGEMPYQCKVCNKRFRQTSHLKRHEKEQHTLTPCDACKEIKTSKSIPGINEKFHTCERKFQCVTCSKKFHSNSYHQQHQTIHTGEKPYLCIICNEKFRFEHVLKKHERTHARKILE